MRMLVVPLFGSHFVPMASTFTPIPKSRKERPAAADSITTSRPPKTTMFGIPGIGHYHGCGMETNHRTRFGVVIPAFGCASTIGATLDAVALQGHRPSAVIVVIDGPDRELEEIVAGHSQFTEILVLPKNTGGPSEPRNAGVDRIQARHELDAVWFLDADDLPAPDFLKVMDDLLQRHSGAAMVVASHMNWTVSYQPAEPAPFSPTLESVVFDLDWYLKNTGEVLPSFSVIRTRSIDHLRTDGGGFHSDLRNNQDYEFFVRMIAILECVRTPWVGGAYRIHEASISANQAGAWDCRRQADVRLANWFERRGERRLAARFLANADSAARRSAKESWHAGRKAAAASTLFRRMIFSLDLKSAAVFFRLAIGAERPSGRDGT